MFHPKKIAAKIAAIEKAKGIKLLESSIEDSSMMFDHFRSMEVDTGRKVVYSRKNQQPSQFSLTDKEKQWIQNEMYMCSCSFVYWYFRYFFIKTKEGEITRPEKLIAQMIFLAILGELDLLGLPILLLILKARQLGMSTVIEAIILWISIFTTGSKCVCASAEEEKSEQMSTMVWLGLEMLPLWMKPVLTRDNVKLGPAFGLIHSEILLQHGSMLKGISRGDTPIAAHLSEVAWYPDPVNTIESSLIRAMHENPRTFLALETTAKEEDDWFHRTWLKNRKGEETGYNRFTCLFLPWYVGRDKYPTADWLRNHPIPKSWKIKIQDHKDWRLVQGKVTTGPLKETFKQASAAKLYVATAPLLKKHMPDDWEMPPEQMWYWEFNYVEAIEGGDETLRSFYAELAADERSAFQARQISIFKHGELDRLEENRVKEYEVYAMTGDGIATKYNLEEYQSQKGQRIDIFWNSIINKTFSWRLIPLKEIPRDDNLKFYLKIWEHPKPGYDYGIGIDVSSGIGQNNSSFSVLRKGREPGEPDFEAALLCSPWISSPETPAFANMLGVYYGKYMEPYQEALIAPEVQIAVGDFISYQLDLLGYTNFYYMERFDLRKHPGHRPNRRGWATVGWSQQMMKEAYEHAIKNDWIQVNSEELIQELRWLRGEETDSGKMKYDHARDKTDDVYVSGGIAYFTMHGKDTIMERMKQNLRPLMKATKDTIEKKVDTGVSLLARQFMREDRENYPDAADEGEGDRTKYVY